MKDVYTIIQEVCGRFQGILREICVESILEDFFDGEEEEFEE